MQPLNQWSGLLPPLEQTGYSWSRWKDGCCEWPELSSLAIAAAELEIGYPDREPFTSCVGW